MDERTDSEVLRSIEGHLKDLLTIFEGLAQAMGAILPAATVGSGGNPFKK